MNPKNWQLKHQLYESKLIIWYCIKGGDDYGKFHIIHNIIMTIMDSSISYSVLQIKGSQTVFQSTTPFRIQKHFRAFTRKVNNS